MKLRLPFPKIVPAYHVLDVPIFFTPSQLAVSTLLMALLLLPVYAMAAGWFGFKIIVLLGLSCAAGAAIEVSGIAVTRQYTGYFGFGAWFLYPLMVPPGMELWMSVSCLALAVIICVVFFGGQGRQVFHASVVAQVFTMINFTSRFGASFVKPRFDFGSGFRSYLSIPETGGTALALIKAGKAIPGLELFFGPNIGFLSDAFPVAVICAGTLYLLFGAVNKRTPVAFLVSLAAFSFIGHRLLPSSFPGTPQTLLAGSVLFYAFFIFSDRWTSAKSDFGRTAAGILAALLTLLMRSFSTHTEGVMFAALFVYAFSPLLDELAFKAAYRAFGKPAPLEAGKP
ncbi:MAG: hypothetical protein A2Z99_02180 [Treponema sp. GWB1_62_6]|nr:MAG: hypothetical protein A2001_03505 [Treponema sp. GWC1_61_84]OHE69682.1 MAG: hypothetical protein A2Z99_02180 [Treponema sp. GWB1_62_6]